MINYEREKTAAAAMAVPAAGNIRFYGQTLTDLSIASVRQAIAYVPQEALLFPTTVAENIAYGNLEAEQDAIIKAAGDAFADEFITSLPDSYAINLGEYGSGISGGQGVQLDGVYRKLYEIQLRAA